MNDCDLNNTNNMDSVQEELKETKPAEELDQEKEIHKSPVIKNSGNETEDIILEDKKEQQNAQKCNDPEESNNIHKKVSAIIDSDSEDEVLFNAKPKRKKAICDNSEDEASDSNQHESEKHPNNNENAKTDFDSDSNTFNINNGNDNEERNRFNALIDSDSEIEEDEEDGKHSTPIPDKKISKRKDDKEPKSKARKVSARASKEEAMKQIRYETQRLIREAEVSVPYHKPRQQSLEAFLSRKKIISALPKAPTMATKLKLCSAIVDEVLKEKEKEAEIFYKSSDSEEETIEDHSDKENLDCQQVVKNPSRKLFTDDKSSASNNQEQNAANEEQTVQEIQQALIETKEGENNEVTADREARNANDSMTVEIHCDFNDPENADETLKPLETSQSTLENDAETSVNENSVEGTHNDSEKSNKDTPDSASKIDHDCDELVIDSPNINEKKSLLKLKSFKPQLKGTPGTMIDLTEDSEPSKGGINSLIDRFVNRHSKVDKCKKDATVTATRIIESPAGISVVKETLPYKGIAAVAEDPKLARPGAKLVRLREELKHKMAQKRNEEWKQREQEMKEQEIEWDESINEEERFSDPGSLTAESSESEEDEPEEFDVPVKSKKKKKKSAYIDDEADVSDEIEDAEEDEDEDRDEDEDDEVLEDSEDCDNEDLKSRPFRRILEPLDEDSRFSSNENDIRVSQEHPEENPICLTPQMKTTCYDLVSPTTQLTALNAQTESDEGSPEIEKQLPILIGFTQSQTFDEKPTLEEEPKQDGLNLHLASEPNVTESQLLNLCSGTFSSQANDPPFSVDVSQNVQTSAEKDSLFTKEDEEQRSKENTAAWNKFTVVSSDEEDLVDNGVKKRAKKKVKKLDLSEDEDEHSSDEEDQGEDEEQDEEKYIDYDSEENEVVVSSKNMKQYATKFLDEEAELSESDCDVSADENEEDLDKLEFEDMDDEEIDESRVKKQLEKLHVKQILDEDQREVRMLKELLFEEGDLFSESGRERKFKWRNIDKQENGDDVPSEDKDGWVDLSDDEEEAKWRKLKYEREKFLAEKLGNMDADIEEDLHNSQILSLGMKVLKKRRINESTNQETVLESLDSKVDLRIPHTVAEMLNNSKLDKNSRTIHSVLQKRSLLAKGEKSLARLAALVKQKDTTLPSFKARNFVFAHIDESPKVEGSSTTTKVMPKPLTAKRNR